jgi:hypothetical protein
VPEWVAAAPTSAGRIRAALLDTPRRLQRTAYVDGVPNGGGSASVGDLVHYAREGVEKLGRLAHEGWKRAVMNVATSIPAPPQVVTARYRAGALTVSWSPPYSRVTTFVVEYQIDGGTWVTATLTRPLDTTLTVTGLTGTTVAVRVSTTNEVGTSAPSTPVTAIGA